MKIFLFYFEMAIKITGSAQNYRVGRVSGNTPIFLGLIKACLNLCVRTGQLTNFVLRGR